MNNIINFNFPADLNIPLRTAADKLIKANDNKENINNRITLLCESLAYIIRSVNNIEKDIKKINE